MRLLSYNCHEALLTMWASIFHEVHLLHYEDVYYWRQEHRPLPPHVFLHPKGDIPSGRFDVALAFNSDSQWDPLKRLPWFKVNALATTYFDEGDPKNMSARPSHGVTFQLKHRNTIFCGHVQKERWGCADAKRLPVIWYGLDPSGWEPGPRDNGHACVVAHDFRYRDNVLDFNWTCHTLDGLPWHIVGRQRDGLPAIYPENVGGLKEIYKHYSVFCYTAHTSPLSFALLEAMFSGMAIVARPYDDIPYFLENGKNAVVTMDSREYRDAVERLLVNKAERERLGSAARETALKLFTLSRWQDDTRAYLRGLGVRI